MLIMKQQKMASQRPLTADGISLRMERGKDGENHCDFWRTNSKRVAVAASERPAATAASGEAGSNPFAGLLALRRDTENSLAASPVPEPGTPVSSNAGSKRGNVSNIPPMPSASDLGDDGFRRRGAPPPASGVEEDPDSEPGTPPSSNVTRRRMDAGDDRNAPPFPSVSGTDPSEVAKPKMKYNKSWPSTLTKTMATI